MGVSFNIMCPNSSIYSDEKSRVLVDKTKSGKVRPWREKKIANVDYFELLHILEFRKSERVKVCAEILEFKESRETGERKLYRVWFCKSRLCPMCNWRRTMKHGIQTQKVVAEVVRVKPKARWMFLTLTVKNVYDGEELNKSLSEMAQGFRRMMQYVKVAKNLVGFMRATEVTVNEIDNSYNQLMKKLSISFTGTSVALIYPTKFLATFTYMRATEVTVNEIDNSYNQHMHVLICVEST